MGLDGIDNGQITLLSYNIKAGQYHADGLEAVARVIESTGPDIVALQEVDSGAKRTGGVDQPAWLARRLGMNAAFGCSFNLPGGGEYGNALLSRWPIERAQVFPLPKASREHSQARWFGWAGMEVLPDPVWKRVKRTPLLDIAGALTRTWV